MIFQIRECGWWAWPLGVTVQFVNVVCVHSLRMRDFEVEDQLYEVERELQKLGWNEGTVNFHCLYLLLFTFSCMFTSQR